MTDEVFTQCPVCEGPMENWQSVEWDLWKPIDSAPLDELVLLAAEWPIAGTGDWRVKVGGWRKDWDAWEIFGASWKPTMWRPIPYPKPNQIPNINERGRE